jgi:hypothetical protein
MEGWWKIKVNQYIKAFLILLPATLYQFGVERKN